MISQLARFTIDDLIKRKNMVVIKSSCGPLNIPREGLLNDRVELVVLHTTWTSPSLKLPFIKIPEQIIALITNC